MLLKKYNQWVLSADDKNYELKCVNEKGGNDFYTVFPGKHGEPVIVAEPDKAFECPNSLKYVNSSHKPITPTEKIAGIICKNCDKVIHRFSLSSPKKPDFEKIQNGAEIIIGGTRWHLQTLFSKDKNRIINYDAWYVPKKPAEVRILELEDLTFKSKKKSLLLRFFVKLKSFFRRKKRLS